MKFFVTFREDTMLSSQYPVPAQLELVGATHIYFEELKKKGKIVDWGLFGTGQTVYTIFSVKSHAELYEIQELAPIRALCRIEGNPVLESGEFADVFGKIRNTVVHNYEKNISTWNEYREGRTLKAAR